MPTAGRTRRPPLDYALLGLLAEQPASGYDLRKIFLHTPIGMYSDSPGSVYPALRRLEASGLIVGRRQRGSTRRRRGLTITARGRAVLRRWIAEPLTLDEVVRGTGAPELRLAFLSDHTGPAALRDFLRDWAELLESHGRQVRATRAALWGKLSSSARLALELGLFTTGARAAWCRRAARRNPEA